MLTGEYACSGLKRGLEFDQKLGANPFKFGMIGSTDSHTSLVRFREKGFNPTYILNQCCYYYDPRLT